MNLTFKTLRAARRFAAGYMVDRVVVRLGKQFAIVSPATAKRRALVVVG